MQNTTAHNNNFDFLRFLFASFVIFSHCYALMGDIRFDPFYKLTGKAISELGVCGFFSISGYLIHQSLQRSSTLTSFIRKRVLRIFPGLIVAVLFSVLVIGVIISTLDPLTYFNQKVTWMYILQNILLIPGHKTLPAVFMHNAETAVNGSLWTLRYELLLYGVLCLFFFTSKAKKNWIFPVIFLISLTGYLILKNELIRLPESVGKFIFYVSNLGSYFFAGVCLSLFPDFLQKRKTSLFVLSAISFLFSLFFFQNEMQVLAVISFSIMVISFGLHNSAILNFSKYTGDISYGTYIYAYPLQQALIVWLKPETATALMLPSFILSWTAGLLSWHLVEKTFIKRKKDTIIG